MNYYDKYIKYKNKYLKLKNMTGGSHNHLIALLWINKVRGPIQQKNKSREDLITIEKIIRVYNMFKIKYSNPQVILFINRDKYIDEDFEELKKAGVEMSDISEMEVIRQNEKLLKLLYPEYYGRNSCPIYQQVDMLKILIQYEYMTNPSLNYDYVVFSDLDIQDEDSLYFNDMECKPDRPDWIDKYYSSKIFDNITLELLDVFGYLMNCHTEELFKSKEKLSGFEKNELCKYGVSQRTSKVKLGNEIFDYYFGNPENMFLISKKDPNVIKAIKDYFIDYLFCICLYDLKCDVDGRNFIFGKYDYFNQYLNFLQSIIFYRIIVGEKIFDKLKSNSELIEDLDYKLKKNDNEYHIDILTPRCFEYFRNIFFDGGFQSWESLNSPSYRYFFNPIPTTYGVIILKKYGFNIEFTSGRRWLKPFKCIPIEKSQNSVGVK